MTFEDANKSIVGLFTLVNGIVWAPLSQPKPEICPYLLTGLLTRDLDLLSLFVGHQGASAKWLCMLCLALQTKIGETFQVEGQAIRFGKRKANKSIPRCYEKYKKEFLYLDLLSRTKAKKEQMTQKLSCSIVVKPLADVPLDVMTRATIHVILGLAKRY